MFLDASRPIMRKDVKDLPSLGQQVCAIAVQAAVDFKVGLGLLYLYGSSCHLMFLLLIHHGFNTAW